MSDPQTLPEKLESLAKAADREAAAQTFEHRARYCEGQAHGLRAAASMISESAGGQVTKDVGTVTGHLLGHALHHPMGEADTTVALAWQRICALFGFGAQS